MNRRKRGTFAILCFAIAMGAGVQVFQKRERKAEHKYSTPSQQARPRQADSLSMIPVPAGSAGGEMTKAQKLHALHHVPKLTEAQAESFLLKNGRDAANLVTAFRTSGVHRYLREAMAKWPEDPQVAFEALALADLSSTERRQWVNAFKRAMPDNSVGNYLSAIQHFRDGSREAALSELETAFGKSKFDDMTLARMQGNEEAYRGSGFSEAQSHVAAMFQLPLPLLNEMRFLSSQIDGLSQSYLQEGDTASAEATVRIALNLGEQYRASGNALLVHQQLGWDIGQNALRTLDPGSQFGGSGRSVQDLLDSMNMQRREVSSLLKESVPLQDRMEPEDWVVYTDRMKMLGEPNAMRWLLAKYEGR